MPLLVEIANVKKAKLGPDDPDTLEALDKLGELHWQLGQFDKSIPVFEEIVKVREAKLGRDDLQTLEVMGKLGASYKGAGRVKGAVPLLEEAHRATKNHPELDWVAAHLIDAYRLLGEYDKGAGVLLERVPVARKNLPKDSPRLGGFLAWTSMNLLEMKKWVEAEPLLRESLAIREKTQPDDWSTFNSQSMLGGSLLGQKKYAEAEPLLLKGYEGLKRPEKTIPPLRRRQLAHPPDPRPADRAVHRDEQTGRGGEVAGRAGQVPGRASLTATGEAVTGGRRQPAR